MRAHSRAITSLLKTYTRLPRGISCIILCNLYHRPKENDEDLINYLYEPLTTIEARVNNCGKIILGNFNKLNL